MTQMSETEKLFAEWVPLAIRLASKRWHMPGYRYRAELFGLTWEDIKQEAQIGCWRACQTFDPSRGFSLGTLVGRCVWNRMSSAVKSSKGRDTAVVKLISSKRSYGNKNRPDRGEAHPDDWLEMIAVSHDREDVETQDLIDLLYANMTPLNRDTISAIITAGYSFKDAAKALGISVQCLGERVKQIKAVARRLGPIERIMTERDAAPA